MKLRRLVAMAASVAVLTAVIAAPVSAGGPATYKVGARGVSFGLETIATNCTLDQQSTAVAAQIGASGQIIGQPLPEYPCVLPDGETARVAAPRNAIDAALRTKTAIRAETTPAIDEGVDYYIVESYTSAAVYGQAGSGYEFTGIGAWAPVTKYIVIAWLWDEDHLDWDLVVRDGWRHADTFFVLEDLAGGGASTWIHGIGRLNVGCVGIGAWGRETETITGGLDPNDGWTYDLSSRLRWCLSEVSIGGTQIYELPYGGPSLLDRTVFATVDVYPY